MQIHAAQHRPPELAYLHGRHGQRRGRQVERDARYRGLRAAQFETVGQQEGASKFDDIAGLGDDAHQPIIERGRNIGGTGPVDAPRRLPHRRRARSENR